MVIPKLGFLPVEVKSLRRHAPELGQADFGNAPEPLDSVDVRAVFFGEFVLAVVHALVSLADIDQAVIPPPAVRLND